MDSPTDELATLKYNVVKLKSDMVLIKRDMAVMNKEMAKMRSLIENMKKLMNKEEDSLSVQQMHPSPCSVRQMKGIASNGTNGKRTPLSFPTVPGLKDAIAKKCWRDSLNLVKRKFGTESPEYQQLQYVTRYSDVLITAFENGFTELIKLFIQNYILVINSSYEDSKMLFFALQCNQRNVMSLLIEEGADVNYTDPSGNSLLHLSAERGYHDIVALLLEAGLDVNATNNRGETPLIIAAKWGHDSVVEHLLKSVHCDREYKTLYKAPDVYYSAVDWAYQMGHMAVVKRLMSSSLSTM